MRHPASIVAEQEEIRRLGPNPKCPLGNVVLLTSRKQPMLTTSANAKGNANDKCPPRTENVYRGKSHHNSTRSHMLHPSNQSYGLCLSKSTRAGYVYDHESLGLRHQADGMVDVQVVAASVARMPAVGR